MTVRFDPGQRFSCRQCGRCCRNGWRVAVLPDEGEALRAAGAARLWTERADAELGSSAEDPVVRVGRVLPILALRLRPDGACGFLDAAGRCRIQSELGLALKPLTCRAFPFHVSHVAGEAVVTTSFSCPTVARNEGTSLWEQSTALERLADEWRRRRPRRHLPRLLAVGRPLAGPTLQLLREILLEMLERRGPDGALDLRANVDRMARTLDDLGRPQVARLAPDRLAEYLELTGRFAARSDKPLAPRQRARRPPRGFILAVWTVVLERRLAGSFLARRFRAARLALHVHGLGPAVGDFDVRRVRRLRWPPLADPLWGRAQHFLRSGLQTLGTGRWPVLAEIGVNVATLNAALALAACASADGTLDEAAFLAGLNQAADVQHAEARSAVRMLGLLSGGVESLHVFASGRLL